MKGAHVVAMHNGVVYEFTQDWDWWTPKEGDRSLVDAVRDMYVDDDYGCDCNLSMFINELCDNAPDHWPDENEYGDLNCGCTIKITALSAVEDGVETPIPLNDDVLERMNALGLVLV